VAKQGKLNRKKSKQRKSVCAEPAFGGVLARRCVTLER
jgi:hypothetical protein